MKHALSLFSDIRTHNPVWLLEIQFFPNWFWKSKQKMIKILNIVLYNRYLPLFAVFVHIFYYSKILMLVCLFLLPAFCFPAITAPCMHYRPYCYAMPCMRAAAVHVRATVCGCPAHNGRGSASRATCWKGWAASAKDCSRGSGKNR